MYTRHFRDRPTISSQTTQSAQSLCPHWFPTNGTCQSAGNGIFLPEYQHVANYCLTGNFSSCRHFQDVRLVTATNGEQVQNKNRRRSDRIPRYRSFRFSEIDGSDSRPGLRQEDAWTVDLSEWGIRFTCRQPLDLKTTLHYQLEGDNTIPDLSGTGQVVWCRPLAGTSLFQTGMAFTI
jgi:hypothetical protein